MRYLLLLFILITSAAAGQDFERVLYDTLLNQYDESGNAVQVAYRLDEYEYHIRTKKIDDTTKIALRLMIFDRDGKLVFRSEPLRESRTHKLCFFKSERFPNRLIILGYNSNEYTWGSDVYLLESGRFKYLGQMSVAAYKEGEVPWDVSAYTRVTGEPGQLIFSFNHDQLIFDPGGPREQMLSNNQISYRYKNGEWKEMVVHE